jgi:hypothetical protein
MCRFLSLIIAGVCLFGLSCGRLLGEEGYVIDKTSPNGAYRLKIEVRAEEPKGTRTYTEHGSIQFFKGQETIHVHEWENSDQYEPSFRENMPVSEWIADNIVRLGEDTSSQPFYDELTISNNTGEALKYVTVNYDKYEAFWVFDLGSGSQVKLRASPGFKPNGTSNEFLSYGGVARSGKKFEGRIDVRKRRTPAEGALKFEITINPKDLH